MPRPVHWTGCHWSWNACKRRKRQYIMNYDDEIKNETCIPEHYEADTLRRNIVWIDLNLIGSKTKQWSLWSFNNITTVHFHFSADYPQLGSYPNQMTEPAQLTPFNVKEQWLYSELPPNAKAPQPISTADTLQRKLIWPFSLNFQ